MRDLTLVTAASEYYREATRQRDESDEESDESEETGEGEEEEEETVAPVPDKARAEAEVQLCRAGESPFAVLNNVGGMEEHPVAVPCIGVGTYAGYSLSEAFPSVASMALLRPQPLTQEVAEAMLTRHMEALCAGRASEEPSFERAVPSAARGLSLGTGAMDDDPFVVLLAAGEVSWHCELGESLPSLQAAVERLEAHLRM